MISVHYCGAIHSDRKQIAVYGLLSRKLIMTFVSKQLLFLEKENQSSYIGIQSGESRRVNVVGIKKSLVYYQA